MMVRTVCDPSKDAANFKKHGISLAEAAGLVWDEAVLWEDVRRSYGERRMVGLVPLGTRLCDVVFTDRDEARRIISLRKANDREITTYLREVENGALNPTPHARGK